MKRALVGIAALALVLGLGLVSTASAGPANKTTITLSCDRATGSATVSFTLQDSLFGSQSAGPFNLNCGPDSTSGLARDKLVQITTFSAGAINISSWTWTTSAGSGGCSGASVLPFKGTCDDPAGVGSQLVAR